MSPISTITNATADPVRKEANFRRRLYQQGFVLRKSRTRNDFGGYMITNIRSGFAVAGANGSAYSLDLDGVESFAASHVPCVPKDAVHLRKEHSLRRRLCRQGFQLRKSRTRKTWAPDFGGFMIVDHKTGFAVAGANGHAFSLSIDDVERFANGPA